MSCAKNQACCLTPSWLFLLLRLGKLPTRLQLDYEQLNFGSINTHTKDFFFVATFVFWLNDHVTSEAIKRRGLFNYYFLRRAFYRIHDCKNWSCSVTTATSSTNFVVSITISLLEKIIIHYLHQPLFQFLTLFGRAVCLLRKEVQSLRCSLDLLRTILEWIAQLTQYTSLA